MTHTIEVIEEIARRTQVELMHFMKDVNCREKKLQDSLLSLSVNTAKTMNVTESCEAYGSPFSCLIRVLHIKEI